MLRIKSKYKIAKRLGAAIFEQTQTQKFALSEARAKKPRGGRNKSDYGRQLLEKQKVRYTYGISERQLSNYAQDAFSTKNPPESLHRSLETRLDSAIYRSGFATTRRAGRQMASHGHLLVNGTRVTIPSYRLKTGDTIPIRAGSRKSPLFGHLSDSEAAVRSIPSWLLVDNSTMVVKVQGEPSYVASELPLDYPAVFEFYSR